MITKIEGKCGYEGCEQPATHIAEGRPNWMLQNNDKGSPLGCYCEVHAGVVAQEGSPEYRSGCPNCGCIYGVN